MCCISEKKIKKIKDVLTDIIDFEDCFAHTETGPSGCLHCNAEEALSYITELEDKHGR